MTSQHLGTVKTLIATALLLTTIGIVAFAPPASADPSTCDDSGGLVNCVRENYGRLYDGGPSYVVDPGLG
jgi:hypothetical protein